MLNTRDILGPEGLFTNKLEHFAAREQQIEMAGAVESALENESVAIIEAGTGTGKTFAYLVPALLSGKKVIVSTGTKNLQDQLFHRDLPVVRELLALPVRVALLKGRANYLCKYRLDIALLEGRLRSRKQIAQLHNIRE